MHLNLNRFVYNNNGRMFGQTQKQEGKSAPRDLEEPIIEQNPSEPHVDPVVIGEEERRSDPKT